MQTLTEPTGNSRLEFFVFCFFFSLWRYYSTPKTVDSLLELSQAPTPSEPFSGRATACHPYQITNPVSGWYNDAGSHVKPMNMQHCSSLFPAPAAATGMPIPTPPHPQHHQANLSYQSIALSSVYAQPPFPNAKYGRMDVSCGIQVW